MIELSDKYEEIMKSGLATGHAGLVAKAASEDCPAKRQCTQQLKPSSPPARKASSAEPFATPESKRKFPSKFSSPVAMDDGDEDWGELDDDELGTDMASTLATPVIPKKVPLETCPVPAALLSPAPSPAPAQSPLAASQPVHMLPPSGGRGRGKGKGRGSSGASNKSIKEPVPAGHKRCNICCQVLPFSFFSEGRAVCSDDDRATENLQRVLKKQWGKKHAANMKLAKKDGKWNDSVVAFRVANKNSKKVIGGGQDRLAQVKKKTKKQRRERVRRKMTYDAFCIHFNDPKNGGDPAEKLRSLWEEHTVGKERVDCKGVVNGVEGHARYRILLNDEDSHSESEDVDERVHEHGTKPGDMSVSDIIGFLSGEVDLQIQGDVELPPALHHIDPQSNAKAASMSSAAPSSVPSTTTDLDREPLDKAWFVFVCASLFVYVCHINVSESCTCVCLCVCMHVQASEQSVETNTGGAGSADGKGVGPVAGEEAPAATPAATRGKKWNARAAISSACTKWSTSLIDVNKEIKQAVPDQERLNKDVGSLTDTQKDVFMETLKYNRQMSGIFNCWTGSSIVVGKPESDFEQFVAAKGSDVKGKALTVRY